MTVRARLVVSVVALGLWTAALPQQAGALVVQPDPPTLSDWAGQCLAYDVVIPNSLGMESRGDFADLLRRGLLLRGLGETEAFRAGLELVLARAAVLRQIPPDRHPPATAIRRACSRLVRVCLHEWTSRGADAVRDCAKYVRDFWSD